MTSQGPTCRQRGTLFCVNVWLFFCGAEPSLAYAYRTAADLPEFRTSERVRWRSPTVHYQVHLGSFPSSTMEPLLPTDVGLLESFVVRSLQTGAETWASANCAQPALAYDGIGQAPESGDGVNTVSWVEDRWRALGFPEGAAGFTETLYQQDARGLWFIAEADVFLNAEDFQWTMGRGDTSDARYQSTRYRSIGEVVAHEFGHVLGLMHACEPDGEGGAPDCDQDESFARHVMFPFYIGARTSRLSSDDEAGLCFLYEAPACTPRRPILERDALESEAACGVWGDPCRTDEECADARCHPDGYCTATCTRECLHRHFTCDTASNECVAMRSVLGAACRQGSDCSGGICLQKPGGASVCARTCDDRNPCPAGFSCDEVDGRSVCRAPAAGGCRINPSERATATRWWAVVGGLLALVMLCRTRRRRSREEKNDG